MQPILNQILFKPFPPKELSEGGLFVPDAFKAIRDKGTIIAVGNGTVKKPMKLKAGMVVHRVKGWGQEVVIDNELYFLMDEGAILAIEE